MKEFSSKRKGFISAYFLGIFLFITMLYSMRIINVQNQLKAMENIKKLHTFEQQESYVINHIKYQLQDICTKDVGLDLPFAYTMDSSTNPIQIHVLTDYYETILVSYHPDTYVLYDYETIRAIPD